MNDYKPTELDIFKAEYYAEKLKRPEPWKDVEYANENQAKNNDWHQLFDSPPFAKGNLYRWKKPTINVNGIEVPAPVLNPDDKTYSA